MSTPKQKERRRSSKKRSSLQGVEPEQLPIEPETINLSGMNAEEIQQHLFNPASIRPLSASRIADADVINVRTILMDPQCVLLSPTVKSQLTDDQVRSLIIACGGSSPVYASLYLTYLSAFQVNYPSVQLLVEALQQLKAESQAYKIDVYLYFNKDLSATTPPQINQKEIEILFVEGGGFLTLTILQYLSSLSSTFSSFDHLKQSLHEQVKGQLDKIEIYKNSLVRFLTSGNLAEFSLENSEIQSHVSSAQALTALVQSELLESRVTMDTIRHLLYIGATDVQLIYLLTRIYHAQKGKRIRDEKKLLSMVKKEWNEFLILMSNAQEWLKNTDKNLLFVESVVTVLSTGASGPAQSKVTTTIHITPQDITAEVVEKIFIESGLGVQTLSVMKSFSKRNMKFRTIDSLIVALKHQQESIAQMALIHTYLNSFNCALFPATHIPRGEITESMISTFMSTLSPAVTIPLVLRECRRYERLGIAYRHKHNIGKDGKKKSESTFASPTASSAAAAKKGLGAPKTSDELGEIPHQFSDWAQLTAALQNTLPKALAQQNLDRENLSLTLSGTNLFYSRTIMESPDALPGQVAKLAYSNRDLDSLLSIIYDLDEKNESSALKALTSSPNTGAANSSAAVAPAQSFSLLDLMSLLRKWNVARKKFQNFQVLNRAVLSELGISKKRNSLTASDSSSSSSSASTLADVSSSPIALDASIAKHSPSPSFDLAASVGLMSPQAEREALKTFFAAAERKLLMPAGAIKVSADPEVGFHHLTANELDKLMAEKQAIVPASGLLTSTPLIVGQSLPASASKSTKDVPLNSVQLFIASLRYLERNQSTPFLNMPELLSAIREHYRLLSSQMTECLKYLKVSKRLFADSRITITWSLSREILALYTQGEASLSTLPLIRRLERERYKEAPYTGLTELIDGVKEALNDLEKSNVRALITDSDRQRVLAALKAASQVPKESASSAADRSKKQPEHQPLLPLAFLEPSVASEQINLLLTEFPLFTILQHIAVLSHTLAMRATEVNALTSTSSAPSGSTTPATTERTDRKPSAGISTSRATSAQSTTGPISAKPAFPTWHALTLAIHESVLDYNRVRTEVFNLLSSPTCVLLTASKQPVPITYESVDRLVKACGLMHADMLTVLQHLNDRGVKLKGLPELAARIKSFHLERRKAEQQAARYSVMKGEIVNYLMSDSCHLFLTVGAKNRVREDLEDDATFVQFIQASGGSNVSAGGSSNTGGGGLKSCLQLLHALELEELAFDSLESIIEGMNVFQAREVLKKSFLPFINDRAKCKLFEKAAGSSSSSSKFKDVRPDDPALNQLLNIEISDAAMEELKKHKKPTPTPAQASSTDASAKDTPAATAAPVENSSVERLELILDFVYRMNASSVRRFHTFQDLVNVVQKELEKSSPDAANPNVQATPQHGPRKSTDFLDSDRRGFGTDHHRRGMSQYQVGYESDEELDTKELARQFVPPSPSAAQGPAGLSRKGSLAMRPAAPKLTLPSHDATQIDGDDIEETEEEKAAEDARRQSRAMEKLRQEVEQLQHHNWILKEDEEWMLIDRQDIQEPPMTEELLNERRLKIFSALSYPACLLFSNRVEPMSLSDIDLDAVLASGGGGEKGLRIALNIIKTLDKKGTKYMWFDQVTLEVARRWQRRKAWEYLTIDPVGKTLLEHNSSVPLFVLRLLNAINKNNGVDPALTAVDLLQLAHEVHPEPFHTHAEAIHVVKELVKTERRETLRAALSTQFANMFLEMPLLTDAKLELVLGGVDDSLYHALKYLEMIQQEGGTSFPDVLDLIPIVTSVHSREKSHVHPDAFSDELEEEDEDAEAAQQIEEDPTLVAEDALMLRRQKIFVALSYPRCSLFSQRTDPFSLTDVDLDDFFKASNNRLAYALKVISVMDKKENLKFQTFSSAVIEVAKRCQSHYATNFLLSHENRLLHPSVRLPKEKADPEMASLIERLLSEGMSNPDPYLTILACLKALNQTPKVLAQAPPAGGYRSIDDLISSLKSLADEQRVWMVKSYFTQATLQVHTINPETHEKVMPPPMTDHQVATILHCCANSIYFVLRHLQTLELAEDVTTTVYSSYDDVINAVRDLHKQLLKEDVALVNRFTPSKKVVGAIDKPNEAKQKALQDQKAHAYATGQEVDRDKRNEILMGDDPVSKKLLKAAGALLDVEEKERAEAELRKADPALQPQVLTSAQRFLADARFQLLQVLSFPRSQIFSKCFRPVSIRDEDLDAVFHATYSSLAEESEHEHSTSANADGGATWLPTSKQVSESIRIVKYFDSCHFHFRSFGHFLKEYRAYILQEKRDILLAHLFFPKNKLFTSCTRPIEIEDRDLDKLLCIPKNTPKDGEAPLTPGHSSNDQFVPLAFVIAALEHLDATDFKVYSFVELVDVVKNVLNSSFV